MLSGLINTNERTMVLVEQIKADGGTQMRAGLDDATVTEYADFFRESRQWGDFPPVVLYHDGADYWLADGFHRVAAWKRAGNALMGAAIPADVRSGTRRDAILYAAGANANHGLRRTNADKRRAVEVMLRDDEWAKWSDAEIARRCNVSSMTVGRIRSELISNNVIDAPSERTVQRGGQTYTQNTANIGVNRPAAQSPGRRYESGLPALNMPAPTAPAPAITSVDIQLPAQYAALYARCQSFSDGRYAVWYNNAQGLYNADQFSDYDSMIRWLDARQAPAPAIVAADARPLPQWVTAEPEPEPEPLTAADLHVMQSPAAATHEAVTRSQAAVAAYRADVPEAKPADDRVGKMVRLIGIYKFAISTFDEYGDLIGAHLETLAAKRELEKLIRHLERECALLEGRPVADGWMVEEAA